MTRRDDANEAAARALWATGGTSWEEANADEREYHRDCAEAALEAALDVLQPTIPNTVDALETLPVGTVLRGDTGEEGVLIVHLADLGWTAGEVPFTCAHLLFRHAELLGVTEWQVLYQPEEDQ